MAGPFDLPVETPSGKLRHRTDKEPGRLRRRTEAPTVPSPAAQVPTAPGFNMPGIYPAIEDPQLPTQSFREVISGRTGERADLQPSELPGWGAYLQPENWKSPQRWVNPLSSLEVLSYPGIRHIFNLGAGAIEETLQATQDVFNRPSDEERRLRRYARGHRPDDSFAESLKKIGQELYSDESYYVKRHYERPFWQSLALSFLDPTLGISKVKYLGGAGMGISDELLQASRSANWVPTYTSPAARELRSTEPKFWLNNQQVSASSLPPSYFDEWFGVGKVQSVVPPIPDFNEWVKLAYDTPSHKKWRQFLDFEIGGKRPFNWPLRAAASLFNEGAIAEDPVAWADIFRHSMDDVIEANMWASMTKVRAMGAAPRTGARRVQYAKPLIPVDDTGKVLDSTKITQRRGLGPNKVKSLQLHDIVENLDHYDIPDVQMKKFLQEIRNVSSQFSKMLDVEKVPIKRMKGEGDFVYLHRVVKTYQNHLADEYADWVQKSLKDKGYVNLKKPGENGWDYIVRVFEEMQGTQLLYPELGGQTTTRGLWSRLGPDELGEWKKIMEDLADLFQVDVTKGRLDQRRTIDYVVNGIKRARAVTYETDIIKELESQGNMTYRLIVNQRIKKALSEFAITKDEFIEGITDGDRLHRLMGITGKEPGLKAMTKRATSRLGALERMTAAVGSAIEGAGLTNKKRTTQYVLSNKTWNIIEAEFPELAEQWTRITSMDIVNVNRVIRNLTKEVTEFNGLTTAKFREYLLDLRLTKFMDDFPSMADSPTVTERGRRTTGVPLTIKTPGTSEVRMFSRRRTIRTLINKARKQLRDAGADKGKALRSVGMPEDLLDAWRKGLEDIEEGIKRGQVTQRELSGVFRRHNKDARLANKMLKSIYEDEFEKNVTRRRERVVPRGLDMMPDPKDPLRGSAIFENPETRAHLLAALKESTKVLRETEDTSLKALQKRHTEILRGAGLDDVVGEEWGQAVGVPGVSGKYIPAQIIKDSLGIERIVTGPELAGMITDRFGYARHAGESQWQQWALGKLTTFATVYRMGKASYDLGLQFIQLSGLLGVDFAHLISGTAGATADMLTDQMGKGRAGWLGENFIKPKGPRFTNTFLPATKATFWSFFDPEYALAYWMKPENYATLSERARYGSLVQPSEMMLGVNTINETLERLARWQGGNDARLRKNAYLDMVRGKAATAAPWGQAVFKHSYGRADAAWSAGRNVAANELWKAFAPFAAKTGDLQDLARMTNLMTGVLSLKGMGTSAFKRNLLNAVGFFSPRYTYAQFAMVGHLLKGNGYTAKQARQMVLGTIAFNTTFFTLAAMALGQDPKINPLPKRLGGDGPDLWTVQVGDKRIGVGGLIYAPMKVMMDTLGAAVDDPDALATFDMSNPVLRAYRGKSAGFTGESWSLITGRDFIGEPVRDGWAVSTDYLSTVVAPIWSEELITEGSSAWNTALADFFGLRGRPEGKWTLYRQTLEEALGKPYGDISDYERRIYRETIEPVKEAYELAVADSEERGRNPEAGEYWNTYEYYRDERDGKLEQYMREIFENKRTYGIQARKYIQTVNATYRAKTDALKDNPRFADVVAKLNSSDSDAPVDAAYTQYWEKWYDPRFIDEELGIVDFRARDAEIALWRETIDPEVLEMVDAWNVFNRQLAPTLLQEYWRDQAQLKDYWNVNTTITADFDLQTQTAWQGFLSADRIMQRSMSEMNPLLASINSMRDNERQKMRIMNPSLDLALLRWGYTSVPVTAEGWEFYEAQAYGMDSSVPGMRDESVPQFDTSHYPSLEERDTRPTRRLRRRGT
jgi:hypothetical protein